MAITTYAGLKSAVADWLNRDDLTAVIPTFVSLAEAEFNRRLRTQRMLKRAAATVSSEYEELPSDFLQMRSLHVRSTSPRRLEFVTPANFLDLWCAGQAGPAQFFTVLGAQLRLAPYASGEAVEMSYFAKIPALSDSNTTNWLLDMAPELYLHASLGHASPYLREDQRVTGWKQLAEDQITQINEADKRAAFNAGPLTMRTAGPTP